MAMVEILAADGCSALFSGSFVTPGFSILTGAVATVRTFGEQPKTSNAIATKNSHLFPLNGGRWFRTDVIYYPVNPFYVVNDLVRDLGQQIIGEVAPVGGHTV